MSEKILACNNTECMKSDECERYRLYQAGDKDYKTFNGNPDKGCGKFIKRTK